MCGNRVLLWKKKLVIPKDQYPPLPSPTPQKRKKLHLHGYKAFSTCSKPWSPLFIYFCKIIIIIFKKLFL
jgi:hypothetical protein